MWQSDETSSSESDWAAACESTLPTWAGADEEEIQLDAAGDVSQSVHPEKKRHSQDIKRLLKRSKAAWAEVARLQNEKAETSRLPWLLAITGWALAAAGWVLYAKNNLGLLSTLNQLMSTAAQQVGSSSEFPVSSRWLESSAVSAASSASAAVSSSGDSGGHHSHAQDALLFLFLAIVISVAIMYITMFRMFHGLQHTVALFVIGTSYGLLYELADLYESTGVLGRSHKMWMNIDPHLLLVTMLPALLTADAMTMDTSVAFRVAKQCIYLAGPGVLVNALLVATFLWAYLPYNWSFMLCLVTGAILCATDPVAVVALLKELGASPTLTVQIQGESLLNDGTAIVLYSIAYNILKGEDYNVADVIIFLVKTAMLAWVLGMAIGFIFLEWIKFSSRKLEHASSLIQTALTLCCAYWSFIGAETVFGISGVLSCVAASLVLAHKMWPSVVDKESMHTIWHMFEYLGNTVIFFLAGCLTGTTMAHIYGEDYLHLIVIYIVLVIVRGMLLFCSRPILRHLGTDKEAVPAADLLVMTWGGLRGAVGLSLAIQVNSDKAEGQIADMDARRVLFYVSGIAALTLCVNATTCPFLVQVLGITQLPEAKHKILMILVQRLRHISNETPRCAIVTKTIAGMLDDVQAHLHHGSHHNDSHNGEEFSFFTDIPETDPDSPGSAPPSPHYKEAEESAAASKCASKWLSAIRQSHDDQNDENSDSTDESLKDSGGEPRRNSKMQTTIKVTSAFLTKGFSGVFGKGNLMSRMTKPLTNVHAVIPLPKRPSSLNADRHNMRTNSKLSFTSNNNHHWPTGEDRIRGLFQRFARETHMQEGPKLVQDLKAAKAGVTAIKFLKFGASTAEKALSGKTWDIPKMPHADQEHDLLRMVCIPQEQQDSALARTFNEVFLRLVRKEYWKLIEGGTFANPKDGELLLLSITLALSKTESDLCDFNYIQQYVTTGQFVLENRQDGVSSRKSKNHSPRIVQSILSSIWFNSVMVFFIIASVGAVHIEEELLKSGEAVVSTHTFWLVLEIVFITIFTVEFLLKFWNLRLLYFQDIFNLFDFVLIALGIAGIVIATSVEDPRGVDTLEYSNQARLVRAARVFRTLRLLRILRVFRFVDTVKDRLMTVKGVSSEVASHMRRVSLLRSFVTAHIAAQQEMGNIFCKDGKVSIPEVARVLVKSQTSAYLAITMASKVEQSVDKKLMTEVRAVRESTDIAEHLEKFILEAHGNGVIGSREAAQFLHPLHSHLEKFYRRLRRTHKGMTQEKAQISEVAARVATAGAETIRARSAGIRASVFGAGGPGTPPHSSSLNGPAAGWTNGGEQQAQSPAGRVRMSLLGNPKAAGGQAAMFGRVKSCPEATPKFAAFDESSEDEEDPVPQGRSKTEGALKPNGAASSSSLCPSQTRGGHEDGEEDHSDEEEFMKVKSATEIREIGQGGIASDLDSELKMAKLDSVDSTELATASSIAVATQSPRAASGAKSPEDPGEGRENADSLIRPPPPDQMWSHCRPPSEPPVSLNSPVDDCLD